MHGGEILIPILVPLGFFLMIFGIIYLHKQENLAMIEKGMNPREFSNRPTPYRNLKNGLLFLGAGVGLLVAYFIDRSLTYNRDGEAIYFALVAIGGGLGLIGSYALEKKELVKEKGSNS